MSRVRLGLTGLAFVFLLILSAAALFGPLRTADEISPAAGSDPLATLGVAPGAGEPPPRAEPKTEDIPAPEPVPVPLPDDLGRIDPFDPIPVPPEDGEEAIIEGELTEI